LLESCLALWLQRSPLKAGGPRAVAAPAMTNEETDAGDYSVAPVAALPSAARVATSTAMAAPYAEADSTTVAEPPPATLQAAAPVATPATESTVDATAGMEVSAPVLEMEVVEELRAIMGSEYQGLVKLFFEDAPLHIQRLQAAVRANDIAAMVAPAHTLKSSSANLGALALSNAAKRIELGARTESLGKPALAVLMLENEFRRAKAALLTLGNA
jgi:HPt (histidine-containing phosphotransfer) domain-containing protein